MDDTFTPLENYGVVGNQETCALIGSNGSLDWLPLPYLDSPSVCAALLDPERGGLFSITPTLKFQSLQRYLPNSNVLVSHFTTAAGECSITDFMPPREAGVEHRMLLRRIEGTRLETRLKVVFAPRFDYGRLQPELVRDGTRLVARTGKLALALQGVELQVGSDGVARGELRLDEGEELWLVMSWAGTDKLPTPKGCAKLLEKTVTFWTRWSEGHQRSESVHQELCHDLAMRSGLALKLLMNPDSGAIAAASTMALPETVGGVRNWDYRFAWIRDASFTAQALFHLGYLREATQYRRWVTRILQELPEVSGLKPCYRLHESVSREEGSLEALGGYRHSAPVRVGNLAWHQTQLDIFGEMVNTVFETTRFGEEMEAKTWEAVRRICDFICQNWGKKDRGIWEMRTPPRHYLHSKLMCWVALDRGCEIARRTGRHAPVAEWQRQAAELRRAILERGFNRRLNSFVQTFGSEDLDATALLIPIHRFLAPEDPRVQSTIDAVWSGLSAGPGLLYRYRADDGIAGTEGAFLLCSFWLVYALSLSRRIEEAEQVFRQVLTRVSPLGLMSEEVLPATGELIGNFPQALSHIGLINAALHLGIAKGHGHQGPPPQSEGERQAAS
ncbi:glucoamylase [Geomonas limicola]|uniref:Glucoamylase n=1 Tax=Geomonas limicola TaxID=2740186 RepID=A0A6V8NB39_9BACT|nr:glycoside hydrolase family 15 protein [Geomonas limicola]GFO68753.1 glucoamylase [Geomonas limicola]